MFNLQKYIANGGTPQALLSEVMLRNPMISNLIKMAKSGDIQEVEKFARNVFNEQGRDFDAEFAEFRKQFK